MPRLAVCQMSSGADQGQNLDQAVSLLRVAAAAGATLAALPENFERMASAAEKRDGASALDGPVLAPIREAARALGRWVLAGSSAEARAAGAVASLAAGPPSGADRESVEGAEDGRIYNT